MTKRFLYELHMGVFRDDGKVMTTKEVIDTLNTIHEENKQLKKENALLKEALNEIKEVMKKE